MVRQAVLFRPNCHPSCCWDRRAVPFPVPFRGTERNGTARDGTDGTERCRPLNYRSKALPFPVFLLARATLNRVRALTVVYANNRQRRRVMYTCHDKACALPSRVTLALKRAFQEFCNPSPAGRQESLSTYPASPTSPRPNLTVSSLTVRPSPFRMHTSVCVQ